MHPPQSNAGVLTTRRSLALVGLICLFWIGTNAIWVGKNKLSPGCDVYSHLELSLIVHDNLKRLLEDPSTKQAYRVFLSDRITPVKWPRLTYLVASAGIALFGRSPPTIIIFTNSVFISIMLFSLFFLGRALYGSRVALLAVALLALSPAPVAFSRSYGLDLPLAAMVTMSLALLHHTRRFTSLPHVLLLIAAVQLTLFTKLQGAIFLAFPLAYAAVQVVIDVRRGSSLQRSAIPVRNLISFCMISLVIGLLLFGPALSTVLVLVRDHSGGAGRRLSSVVAESVQARLLYYPINAVFQLSPLIFIPVIVGFFVRQKDLWFWGALLVPTLIFTLVFSNLWARFFLPALPLLALAGASGLLLPRRKRWRWTACGVVLCLGLTQLLVFSFVSRQQLPLFTKLRKAGLPLANAGFHLSGHVNYTSALEDLTADLRRIHPTGGRRILVGLVEEVRLKRGFGALTRLLLRVGLPERKLNFLRAADQPKAFFHRKANPDHVVVLTGPPLKKPRPRLAAIIKQYQQKKRRRSNWPYYGYNYLHPWPTRRAADISRWPEVYRAIYKPVGVGVQVLSRKSHRRP